MAAPKDEILRKDLPKFEALIGSTKRQIRDVQDIIGKVDTAIRSDESGSSMGMSFLDLKNHLMLSYLQNLTFLMMKKHSGRSIENDAAILRIVEIRTVLEKIRPLESRLKYHIDKLLKASVDDNNEKDDPLKFRPNPDQLVEADEEDEDNTDVDEDGEDQSNESKNRKKSGVYIPPRVAAMPYNLDETPQSRHEKETARAKKRALHSSIVRELRQEYHDEPEEIQDRDIYRLKADKRAKEREEYEERNMVRLNVSKKDKARSKKIATMGSLSQLADFHDFRAVTGEEADDREFGQSSPKKRKAVQKKGKGKKGKKFKKRH